MKTLSVILIASAFLSVFARAFESIVKIPSRFGRLEGSLFLPENKENIPVALLIAGSGPIDRDGNGPGMENNSLKMISDGLLKNNIACLRYDKPGSGNSIAKDMDEKELRFRDYIADVENWVDLLKQDKRFSKVIVVGHSEGSLLGMIAAKNKKADYFISISGPGRTADKVLKEQLSAQPKEITEEGYRIIDKLLQGEIVHDIKPWLYSGFRPSAQPYLMSWFKYNPCEEIAKLDIPVLIIQGTVDLQVTEKEAYFLKEAYPKAELKLIQGMNHLCKESEKDRMKNLLTYNDPDLEIKKEVVEYISEFIKKNENGVVTNK